jgi:hypothetical protein
VDWEQGAEYCGVQFRSASTEGRLLGKVLLMERGMYEGVYLQWLMG